MNTEREEMIVRLRLMSDDTIGQAAADMLAADAKDEWHRGRAAGIEECESLNAELQKLAERVPMTPTEIDLVMRSVYAEGNHGRNLEHAFARGVEAFHKIGVK